MNTVLVNTCKFLLWYLISFLCLFIILLIFIQMSIGISDYYTFVGQYRSKIILGLSAPSLIIAINVIIASIKNDNSK